MGKGNVIFDGPAEDEDFGLEQVTGNPADRYKFRSSPLRNTACSRRSFITEHSAAWKTQSGTTWMFFRPFGTITRSLLVSTTT